ncbi:cytochrome c oxidase assembly protein [Edaphobacter aggregans]|uniref:cytochrome c oxidase assembly protein n=1 Tax=Edaphobacter aggregans TaxID=570835 RepID=UPI00068A68DA|nr:cytochrome c oxidase assembly protein [Edaphobacter aggregans]
MPHAHHTAFESLSVSAALILLALIYVRGWIRNRRFDLETIEAWRAVSFLIGLFFIWIAIASPVMGLDHQLLTAHMVQHLLLMTLAPPLIWLGAPVKALLWGLPQQIEQAVISLCRHPQIRQLGKALAHPVAAWFGAAATLVGWHIPPLFMLGLQSGMWHGIEQVSFLVTGLLYWWPVIQPWPMVSKWPEWSILLYLFFATLPCDILSGFLVFCDRVVYPVYFPSSQPFGLSALEDQQCAGALMWTIVTVVYLVAGTIVAMRLLSPTTSRQYRTVESDSQPSAAPQTTRHSVEVV